MSDEGKKNPRDNVSPKLKPKDVKNENVAPPGHMGLPPQGMDLGMGTNARILDMQVRVVVQENEPDSAPELPPEEQRAEFLNNLPKDTTYTTLTGNEQIDNESIAQGDVPVTDEELAALKENQSPQSRENDFDQMMQDDGSIAFQTTNDRAVNQQYRDRGERSVPRSMASETETTDRPQGTISEMQKAFERFKGQAVSKQQSKDQGPSQS